MGLRITIPNIMRSIQNSYYFLMQKKENINQIIDDNGNIIHANIFI